MKRIEWYWYFTLMFAFLIGNYRGYIALWRTGTEEPLKVFPYSVSSLPPSDQQKVNAGIHIEDEESLMRLLQDYLS